jgi:hypothetical protein
MSALRQRRTPWAIRGVKALPMALALRSVLGEVGRYGGVPCSIVTRAAFSVCAGIMLTAVASCRSLQPACPRGQVMPASAAGARRRR